MFFLVKKHATFKWKDTIPGFPVSPGSAKALVRWSGKTKYTLINYFIGNIFAKNCCNQTVYVKIIASQRWDVLFETQWICMHTFTTTVLRPLYRTTCVSQHPQLRTGGFCWSKVLLPRRPCWRQLAHLDYGEDARVLLSGVTCTVSIPSVYLQTNNRISQDLQKSNCNETHCWHDTCVASEKIGETDDKIL